MMKKKVTIRKALLSDISQMLQVEGEAWEGKFQFSEKNLENLIDNFPGGNVVAEVGGKIQGFINVIWIDSQFIKYTEGLTWYKISNDGNGFPETESDALYGINLSVSPHASSGVSVELMEAVARLAIEYGVKNVFLGSRMPRYYKKKKQMTAQEYIGKRNRLGKPMDPEIYLYEKAGLKIVRLIENYFEDPESCNYGVLMKWKNPFYGWPFPWLWKWFFKI